MQSILPVVLFAVALIGTLPAWILIRSWSIVTEE